MGGGELLTFSARIINIFGLKTLPQALIPIVLNVA